MIGWIKGATLLDTEANDGERHFPQGPVEVQCSAKGILTVSPPKVPT